MSLYSNGGSSNWLYCNAPILTQWPNSFCTVISPDNATVTAQRPWEIEADTTTGAYDYIQTSNTLGNMYCRDYMGTTGVIVYGGNGSLTSGWQPVTQVNDVASTYFETPTSAATADTTNKGTFVASQPNPRISLLSNYSGSGNKLAGYIAMALAWDGYALTSTDLASIKGGSDPSLVAAAQQTTQWDFRASNSYSLTDTIGSLVLTNNGGNFTTSTNDPTYGGTTFNPAITFRGFIGKNTNRMGLR